MTVPGTSPQSYRVAMEWVRDAVRTAGADCIEFDYTTFGHVLEDGDQAVWWTATVEFPDGHTLTGSAPMPVDREHYAAIVAASCDLLMAMGRVELATRIRNTEFDWGTA